MKADYAKSMHRLAQVLAGNALTDGLEGGTGQLESLSDFAHAVSIMFDDVDYDNAYESLRLQALRILREMEADLTRRNRKP